MASNKMLKSIMKEFRNDRSMELYEKPEDQLQLAERINLDRYCRDYLHPVWKQVTYDGEIYTSYLISNLGIIVNVNNNTIHRIISKWGHISVSISDKDQHGNTMRRLLPIHRLVAQAFIPNPENKPEVNHIIPKPWINWVGNLEWCTHAENIQFMINSGRQIVGEAHKNSKCTEDQIREVCKLLEKDELAYTDISRITGVPMKTITHIRFDGGWPHISKNYNYPTNRKPCGARYSPVSNRIIDLVKEDKTNKEIIEILTSEGFMNESITNKSVEDRIYHIKKMIRCGTLNDYRKGT